MHDERLTKQASTRIKWMASKQSTYLFFVCGFDWDQNCDAKIKAKKTKQNKNSSTISDLKTVILDFPYHSKSYNRK